MLNTESAFIQKPGSKCIYKMIATLDIALKGHLGIKVNLI